MSKSAYIYLDNNSTTCCAPEVVVAMAPYFVEQYGNPASPHAAGHAASGAIASARQQVSMTLGTKPERIIFTGSATESNNMSILGLASQENPRKKLLVSAIEHKSVQEPAYYLRQHGFKVETIPVNSDGVVDLDEAAKLIDNQTLCVSIQGANNETGVIQPVHKIAQMAHKSGALCHCDAVQLLGKVNLNIEEMEVDLASLSAHKAYGPKGIGALFLSARASKALRPTMFGGHQERGFRPGTLNVPAIVGFGSACQLVCNLLQDEAKRIGMLRDKFESEIGRLMPEARINGRNAPRIPGTFSLTVFGIPSDMLIANLINICIGNGSACNSGAIDPSHVLLAMGCSREEAASTLRISLGRYNNDKDIEAACCEIVAAVNYLKLHLDLPKTKML